MTTQKCAACHRTVIPDGKYCIHHQQALDSFNDHYKAWVGAYGSISWQEFSVKLLEMKGTGSWVKEVIETESKK